MNLIMQVARHLEFCGLGVLSTRETPGDITYGHMPDEPDEAICVYSTDSAFGGSSSGARVQIMVRGKVGQVREPYERACAVTQCIEGFHGMLGGDGPFARIETVNSACGMGQDERGRELFTSNYIVAYCDMDD